MRTTTYLQLSLMMFLNFLIWGFWFVTLGTYLSKQLQASDGNIATAFGTQSWGAIIAPFIIGLIADKYFPAQRILGLLHLVGAALLYYLSTAADFTAFYPALLGYMILFMPTLALVNSVALRQMSDAEKQFSFVRVWGTAGWIVAGLVLGYLGWESKLELQKTFQAAAIFSALLGVYSFTLPHTPPAGKGEKLTIHQILGLDSLKLLADKNYLIFFVASMLICIPLAFYYSQTNLFLNESGMEKAAGKMSLGQASELIFLFLMPFFFRKFNIKWMLLIGMIAWAVRYLFFAYGNVGSGLALLYGGIILHGICYDFFFVTGQIYTDKKAGPAIQSSAQGMITLATYGIGMLIGFEVAGAVVGNNVTPGGHNWQQIWLVPACIAGAIALLFILLFQDKQHAKTSAAHEIPASAL